MASFCDHLSRSIPWWLAFSKTWVQPFKSSTVSSDHQCRRTFRELSSSTSLLDGRSRVGLESIGSDQRSRTIRRLNFVWLPLFYPFSGGIRQWIRRRINNLWRNRTTCQISPKEQRQRFLLSCPRQRSVMTSDSDDEDQENAASCLT